MSICEAMATGGSVNQITGVFNSAPRKLDPPGGVVCCYLIDIRYRTQRQACDPEPDPSPLAPDNLGCHPGAQVVPSI